MSLSNRWLLGVILEDVNQVNWLLGIDPRTFQLSVNRKTRPQPQNPMFRLPFLPPRPSLSLSLAPSGAGQYILQQAVCGALPGPGP